MSFHVFTVAHGDQTLAALSDENEMLRRHKDTLSRENDLLASDLAATRRQLDAALKPECDRSNALVHQKTPILTALNDGDYARALSLLEFAEELWRACGYGYKADEINARIREELRHESLNLQERFPRMTKRREEIEGMLAKVS